MKYLYSLLWLCTVFFFSCNGGLPDAEETEGEIEIFPDYKGVAVPCNIAPLNFKLKEPCEAIALFSGKDQQIRVNSDNGSFQIPEKKWRRLLDASVGGNLTVGIYICKDNRWFRYPPFSIQVIKDKIASLFGLSPYRTRLPDVEQDGDLPALPGGFYGRNLSRQ